MSSLFEKAKEKLLVRKQRIEEGLVNCIPFGLPRFEEELPGVEQGKYYLVTANSKIGKTQLSDKLFLYAPFFYAYKHREELRLKIKYFSLEMSAEEKYNQFICHLLFVLSKGKIRITPKDLTSTSRDKPLSQDILDLMDTEEYQNYFKFFEETVEIIETVRNPYGIFLTMKNYAKANGTSYKKDIEIIDNSTGEVKIQKVFSHYEANDPDEYVICLVDHASLLSTEGNGTIKQSIDKLSSEYFIDLRNRYNYIPVLVQQQSAAQEGVENFKLNKIKPTLDGLAESKLTGRDANYVIGLYSPFRYEIPKYLGYDITLFKDQIRFMELIASRGGGGGTICPLFFDGGVNFFKELPLPNNTEAINNILGLVDRIRTNKIFLMMFKHNKRKDKNG